ncbi:MULTISPECIES: hypothetical protein [unclassified Carboxylicivirga]|uniref:hypothetical protein n=1 Tax=Carboxylicivirga TaxID=1628153 RepID=UPI003D3319F6
METKIIDDHPFLNRYEDRFRKILDSLVVSFQLEGIHFSDEELQKMVVKVESELKK